MRDDDDGEPMELYQEMPFKGNRINVPTGSEAMQAMRMPEFMYQQVSFER
jgi:hypothetical protein